MGLSEQLKGLSPERRRRVLEQLKSRSGKDRAPAVSALDRRADAPLSYGQQRIWYLSQVEENASVFNECSGLLITGALHVDALERALNAIVSRHEALRTGCVLKPEGPVQIVDQEFRLRLEPEDWSQLAEHQATEAIDAMMREEEHRTFDLSQPGLIRFRLARLSPKRHVLVFTVHHVVFDRWSTGILVQELNSLYRSFERGEAPSLAPLPLQYADFAAWERQRLAGKTYERLREYWTKQFADTPPVFELPTDYPRSADQRFRGGRVKFAIERGLTEQCRQLAQANEGTLFMVLLAAYAALLRRYAPVPSLVIGSPFSNRDRTEFEPLIGFFVNTLAFRLDTSGNPSFQDFLVGVRRQVLGAFEHQEMPFDRLADLTGADRSLARHPVFQVMFVFQNTPETALRLNGLEVEPIAREGVTSHFDLTLEIAAGRNGLDAALEYNAELFRAETVERMARHFQALLEQFVSEPNQRIGDVAFLTEAERERLLGSWSRCPTMAPRREPLFHERFEDWANRERDRTAVVAGDRQLSYGELHEGSNRLARALAARGVGPEVRVGICLDRTVDLAVAVLGAMKAGGVWVPLDPAYPTERLAYMCRDADVAVILTTTEVESALPESSAPRLLLDQPIPESLTRELPEAAPENAAYVIYTSGSTGWPKGVVISQRSLAAMIDNYQATYVGAEPVRILQVASFSFDVFIGDMVRVLSSGGCLVVATADQTADPAALHDLIQRHQIHLLDATPGLVLPLVEHVQDRGDNLDTLKVLNVGADALPTDRYWALRSFLNPATRLLNSYGVTEATIESSFFEETERSPFLGAIAPIGRPLPGIDYYVLDPLGRLSPIGAPGELCLGGDVLARGYLGKPGVTGAKFIPHPFAAQPGARLYATGDRARYLPDGNVEFLGRIDQQVKVRGFRIELGEIESALERHEQVRSAVAAAPADRNGRNRLVAYVTPESGKQIDGDELAAWLAARLPRHMVPSAIMALAELPLSPNGKIDRKALPDPGETNQPAGVATAPPRNQIESRLLEIWRELLPDAEIGVFENFFELGGDSVLSIQISNRARRRGMNVRPRDILDRQTIAELAELVGEASPPAPAEGRVDEAEFALTPIQHSFFELEGPKNHFNQSVMLEVPERIEAAALEQVFRQVVGRHDALRLRFRQDESSGQWRQHVVGAECVNAEEVFEQVDLTGVADEDVAGAIETECRRLQQSLDVRTGPLCRCAWLNFGRHRHGRVLVVAHHLVVDAVSWQILLEDLIMGYGQLTGSQDETPPVATSSYRSWSDCLSRAASSAVSEAELDYWLSALGEGSCERRILLEGDTIEEVVELGEEETSALLRRVAATDSLSLHEFLLGLVAYSISGMSSEAIDGQNLVIEVEGHGREDLDPDIDLLRTVGWFTATYPLRIAGLDELGLEDSIDRVCQSQRGVPRNGIGYGMLRHLNPTTSPVLQARPQPLVLFNFLGRWDGVSNDLGEWRFAQEPVRLQRASTVERVHGLEINALVMGGRLKLHLSCDCSVFDPQDRKALRLRLLQGCSEWIGGVAAIRDEERKEAAFLVGLNRDVLAAREESTTTIRNIYPLPPLGQGLVFHTLYDRDSAGAYIVRNWIRFGTGLDIDAFREAWTAMARRHEMLRAGIVNDDNGEPFLLIHDEIGLPWTEQDWRERQDWRKALDHFLVEDRARSFDLSEAPLWRALVARLPGDEHLFVLTLHHVLLDGWGQAALFQELVAEYGACCEGQPPGDRLPLKLEGYFRCLQSRDPGAAREFWRNRLQGYEPCRLLDSRSKDASEGDRVEKIEFELSESQTAALEAFGRARHVTANIVFQGAWGILLSRLSGLSEVWFGMTVSGRSLPVGGIEEMVGLFINTVPVRAAVSGEQRLSDYLHGLQQAFLEQEDFDHVPLVELQSLAGCRAGQQLFESLLVFENYPVDQGMFTNRHGLQVLELGADDEANYPLCLVVSPGPRLKCRLMWSTATLERKEAETLAGRFRLILEQLTTDDSLRVGQINLVGDEEIRDLIHLGVGQPAPYPDHLAIPEVFAQQATTTPEALAMVCGDGRLSYRELERRAAELADALRAADLARPGESVGLMMERSLELPVCLLAILKCGCAYVPLDQDWPTARRQEIAHESQLRVILCQEPVPEEDLDDCRHVAVSGLAAATAGAAAPLDPGAAAYTMFTSGSTGRPKGVTATHRAVVRLVKNTDYVNLDERDVFLQMAPVSFDASTLEIWGCLLNGGRLVMMPAGTPSLDDIAKAIQEHGVTVLWLTAGLFHLMVDERLEGLRGVRQLLAGGDVLSPGHVRRALEALPDCEVINGYGPTENTTFTCCCRTRELSGINGTVPIGRPIANTQVYVVDEELNPQPPGVAGELLTGGDGLALGYEQRPGMTAERFVPDPFSSEAGGRLYRTGDRARWRADGQLEFIGRVDQQVKIRGFRVEPGEIEARLKSLAGVRDAAVVIRELAGGKKQIVGYYTPHDATPPSRLLGEMAGLLPDFMLPDHLVRLDELPLNANGKIDRGALPAPEIGGPAEDRVVEPAGTDTERGLLEIWREILGESSLGVEDNFFEFGGQSLLATQVTARIRNEWDIQVGVGELFEHSTVRALAARIDTLNWLADAEPEAVEAELVGGEL